METATSYKPINHGNTKKIAEVVANSLEAELINLKDFNPYIMKEYDIIGFDTDLYWFKPHKKLSKFIEDYDIINNKKVFIISTSEAREKLGDI